MTHIQLSPNSVNFKSLQFVHHFPAPFTRIGRGRKVWESCQGRGLFSMSDFRDISISNDLNDFICSGWRLVGVLLSPGCYNRNTRDFIVPNIDFLTVLQAWKSDQDAGRCSVWWGPAFWFTKNCLPLSLLGRRGERLICKVTNPMYESFTLMTWSAPKASVFLFLFVCLFMYVCMSVSYGNSRKWEFNSTANNPFWKSLLLIIFQN